jgi:hypothetical protein
MGRAEFISDCAERAVLGGLRPYVPAPTPPPPPVADMTEGAREPRCETFVERVCVCWEREAEGWEALECWEWAASLPCEVRERALSLRLRLWRSLAMASAAAASRLSRDGVGETTPMSEPWERCDGGGIVEEALARETTREFVEA